MLPHSALSVTGGSRMAIKKKRRKGKMVEGRMRSSSLRSLRLHRAGCRPGTLYATL